MEKAFALFLGRVWQVSLCVVILMGVSCWAASPIISGELRQWHKVTITFEGPETSEGANPNPFMDYRLNVRFNQGERIYTVPGYFAADGDAANTSAEAGNKWRVHFAPPTTGSWHYEVSFRQGSGVAVSDDPQAGSSGGFMDGVSGDFEVLPTNKSGRDLRGKGMLNYVGGHYLQFAGTGEYFLKCGADAPENLLAYADFDGDFKTDGIKDNLIKTWGPHVQDWREGDPVWQGDKGKGLIGAINYLAAEGLNSFSFIPMNINGDDKNVFPYTTYTERYRMDVSKLDQWEVIFEHGTRMGMYLHFKTQETENELLLDGGDVGPQRSLYYRELIARYSHHLALNWNLGEEDNDQTTAQRKAMAQYFYDHDPYHHLIVIHNGRSFDDLLGPDSKLTGVSVQTNRSDFSRVHDAVLGWIQKSAAAGKKWVVACDEPGDASHALVPDADDLTHDNARRNALWGVYMAGSCGIEWYFGYKHANSDLTCEDFRSRDLFWDQCRVALDFFRDHSIPFWDMTCDDELTSNTDDYCFYQEGKLYLIFLKHGGTTSLPLPEGDYHVRWYNTREGGPLQTGTIGQVSGGEAVTIGLPPADTETDWLAMLTPFEAGADINEDGHIDLNDEARLAESWLNCNDPANPDCDYVFANPMMAMGIQPAGTGLDANLIGYWKLDELTGLTAKEEVAGQDGTLVNFTGDDSQWGPGYNGNGLTFDGIDDHVTHSLTLPQTQGTVMHWLKPSQVRSMVAYYESDGSTSTYNGYGGNNVLEINTGIYNGKWNATYQDGGVESQGKVWISAGTAEAGVWTHVAVTWDLNDALILYVNGQEAGRASFAGKNFEGRTATELQLGKIGDDERTDRNWKGAMDEVRVYDIALSADQIGQLAAGGNRAPLVNAGVDQELYLAGWEESLTLQLFGTVSDDGQPENAVVDYHWSTRESPQGSTVTFIPHALELTPMVTVNQPGRYVFELSANDTEKTSGDLCTVMVIEPDCQLVRQRGWLLEGDFTGPDQVPDCQVDMWDLMYLAGSWLTH